MEATLTDLWNGKIHPHENLAPNTKEFLDICKKLENETKHIKSVLSAEDKVLFDTYEETSDIISEILLAQAFIRGFRYATLIMVDVHGNNDAIQKYLKMLSVEKSDN